MTQRSATLIGMTAILMWSLLALLTVASGTVPPFQLAAMTFAIGACVGASSWIVQAGRLARVAPAARRVARRGRRVVRLSRALFHFAAFAPPAEAGLVNYLWPLLIVLFSALLPGERLAAASRRRRAAWACRYRCCCSRGVACRDRCWLTCRASAPHSLRPSSGARTPCCRAGLLRCRPTLSPVSVRRRRCSPRSAIACSNKRLAANIGAMARCDRARHRAGWRRVLHLGYRHEARRHPRHRRRRLRDAAAVDRVSHSGRLCRDGDNACCRRDLDRRRRIDRGEGYAVETKTRRVSSSACSE